MLDSIQKTSLPESTTNALRSAYLITKDSCKDDIASLHDLGTLTILPGEKSVIVYEIARTFAYLENPITDKPFLSWEIVKNLPVESKGKLSGPILEAVKTFQSVYMGQSMPTGSLGAEECKRILTLDCAVMLTQLTNPKTRKPYLDFNIFFGLPRLMQVNMSRGYTTGNMENPVLSAYKTFLTVEKLKDAGTEETENNFLYNYQILKQKWIKELRKAPRQ
jgi:hypothetical protein